VLPLRLAIRLRDAGLEWKPAPGDRFGIPNRGMDDEVFVLSTMTIEVHDLPGRTVIGFNGTTEWALDDVDKDATIWLPREDQLRELLGDAFQRLERAGVRYRVVATVWNEVVEFTGDDPEAAYAEALLHLLAGGSAAPGPWT
jgi:nucleotide-binding universal stress UspA family protein